MNLLDISEVSKQTGIAASTLRYYEEQGLIASAGRRGLKRLFEPNVILKLAFIALGKAAGFSLDEISAMVGPHGEPQISRDKLHERANDLDDQIKRMKKLSDAIRHVADCPHPSHMECGKFRRLLYKGTRPSKSNKASSTRKQHF